VSTTAPAGDRARICVTVAVAPEVAFEVFTRELDEWWLSGPQYRFVGRTPGVLIFEPRIGGRLFESFETESGSQVFERGRVTAWDPPARLAFSWRAGNFTAHESTQVEVSFEPTPHGTCVTVVHSGWAALREGHPARHGLTGAAVSRMIGLWWGELLTGLREHLDARAS